MTSRLSQLRYPGYYVVGPLGDRRQLGMGIAVSRGYLEGQIFVQFEQNSALSENMFSIPESI